MSDEHAKEQLADIHEKCLNLIESANLPLPDSLHLEALRGAIQDIASMTKSAYDEVVDD